MSWSPALAGAHATGVNPHSLASAPPKPSRPKSTTPSSKPKIGRESAETGLHGNVYTGVNVSFSVAFDDTVWTDVEAYDAKAGYEGFAIRSETTIGVVEAISDETVLNDCLGSAIAGLETESSIENVIAAPELQSPKSAVDAGQAMISLDLVDEQGVMPFSAYIECRVLIPGERVLRTELSTPTIVLDDSIPVWEGLLAGIDTGDAAAAQPPATSTPAPDADADASLENVVGTTYTSPKFGFSISWPETYSPTIAEFDEDVQGDWLWVGTGDGSTDFMIFSGSTDSEPATVAQCLEDMEAAFASQASFSNVQLLNDEAGNPIRHVTGDTASALYSFTYQTKTSTLDQIEYLYGVLDPTRTFILDVSFDASPGDYDAASLDLQMILDSIRFE